MTVKNTPRFWVFLLLGVSQPRYAYYVVALSFRH